ncbi:MAG: sugar nucleotide-binding protein [Candidatus Peregrinibacteria bacterium]
MRVLMFGALGYLGELFLRQYPGAITPPTDIADSGAVADILDREKPDVVINAAGKTGRPNVDWCEDHKEETLRSNVTGPLILFDACAERGIYWMHISSGCIYEGDNGGRGYTEEDTPNFTGSFYSRTKAWSDQMLREFPVLVLRLRMPFDGSQNPRSLLTKLSRYQRVLDVPNSITYLPDFLKAATLLIERRKTGVFNVVNDDAISPYGIMEMYRSIIDPNHAFQRLTLEDLPAVVRVGRSNCILSNGKLKSEGIAMKTVEEAVREALLEMKRE